MSGFPRHQPHLNIGLAGAAVGLALGLPSGPGWGVVGLILGIPAGFVLLLLITLMIWPILWLARRLRARNLKSAPPETPNSR